MANSPYDWNFIKQFHKNSPLITIGRTKNIENKYLEHKLELKNKNINLDNYITSKYFKDNQKYVFVENQFPYNVDKNITHYLLWFNPNNNNYGITEKEIEEILNEILVGKTYIYFENMEHNKSIKSIKHIHVFVYEEK